MGHALARKPLDLCVTRGESEIVLGNAAVVRVLEVGADVDQVRPGQRAILFPVGKTDSWGYMTKALGYDHAGGMGCLASRMTVFGRQLIPIPDDSQYSSVKWTAFSVRYVTAWANWELTHAVLRLLVDEAERPRLHVWGWGGGTTLAELDLARRFGHETVMLSGSQANLELIARTGVTALDRRSFGELAYDRRAHKKDPDAAAGYKRAERAFLAEVEQRTEGHGVDIFVDLIGTPVFHATIKSLAREAIVTTAGWKLGMSIDYLRAAACISHHQFVHTHFAKHRHAVEAIEFAERTGWIPEEPARVYTFDEIPQLAEDYERGQAGYFPCFEIYPD